ncbi:MAG: 2-dehydropantoate 2-reductase [Limisphaerales bacterium]
MAETDKIYILGCGAIGLTLAAYLAHEGRNVVAVRTSKGNVSAGKIIITVNGADAELKIPVEMVSLSKLATLHGMVVVTAKSYANKMIATSLVEKGFIGPIVIMQNGINIENAFLESQFSQIYRCVLYTTVQTIAENKVTFRPIASCPVGTIKGDQVDLEKCVRLLATRNFPFHAEKNIQRDVWKKAIVNAVFNSICPLLDVDNGIFTRDENVAKLAEEIISECVVLAKTEGVSLTESELMEQILRISKGSDGVLISTLQDIRNGRETEIESLNLEMARMASSMRPKISLGKTGFLGNMILAKSRCHRMGKSQKHSAAFPATDSHQPISSSSTSKIRVEFGGIAPG